MSADRPEDERQAEAVTLWQTVQSVSAAMFGVQSSKNRKRDFSRGKPLHFIVIGLLMVGVFIGVLVLIVKILLHNAGL
ncbi:DUF2970 domain-containing protein [Solimonas terrae]|uniref:DUF2970 domain-containing protein n=1 Tax=Solimonas terrae TaxID=1396819 RepID=A0A6M2BNQ9_9GAMM|nr:DUF2970 domain-containing protein [Solimonas terrae]NGY03699.1 DUF2970 domain-containing protein [Solimonas terrae]